MGKEQKKTKGPGVGPGLALQGRGCGAGHSPGSGGPMSTVNQQGTRRGVEHHGVAGGSRGPPTCRNHLLPIAPTDTVEVETEEAGGEEVVLGAAT